MANPGAGSNVTRRHVVKGMIGAAALAGSSSFAVASNAASFSAAAFNSGGEMDPTVVRHSTLKVGGVTVFYREAGSEGRPVLLLLHGFANSSHYFRHLMPLLANRFHLIAPDLPSFGFTRVEGEGYRYTFAQLTQTIQAFVDTLGLRRFAMYVFDYGAPIGFNLAVADPDRITAIISQNGNAYEEGLGEGPWAPLRAYWKQPSAVLRDKIKERMTFDGVRAAYFAGVPDVSRIEPEAYWLDAALLAQPGMMDLQADLKLDYKANIERYPLYQEYLRTHRPAFLAIWGKNDSFFIPPGAEAFKRDVPDAEVKFLDTGHFALETNVEDIASAILKMPMRG
jgi:pimeloyl-ACP methyl ester carboxylesterase